VIVIGVDSHKKTHTFVAVDQTGRQLAQRTLPATSDGHVDALRWAAGWPERVFAAEDCRHLTRRLEADLLRAGEQILRVPTRLMATARRSGRQRGKSDPIDALAVARAALREPDLPVASLDGPARRVRLLVDHRDNLVAERTRIQSRLRWHLRELAPTLEVRSRGLGSMRVLDDVDRALNDTTGLVADLARELVGRCRALTRRINELERDLTPLVADLAPSLLAIVGCGADRRQAGRGDRRRQPVPLPGRVRPVQRHRADPGLVGQPRAVPAQPGRQPAGQPRAAPHRGHPAARDRPGSRVRAATHQCRGRPHRGGPAAAPAPVRRGLPGHARRRSPSRALASGRGLT